jgi:branched-chain amino acid transport system substrate-binding protein
MNPRKAAVLLVIAGLAASCGRPEHPPVLLGLNLELTGDIQTIGQSAQNAAQLFFDRLNEAGGVGLADGRHPVELLVNDNGANATQAAAVAQRQISRENITAMIGPNSGKCATAASEIAEALKCVMVSPWSADPMTTMDPVGGVPKRYVFRAGATGDVQGRVMAAFALSRLGARTAAIMADAEGDTQAAGFEEVFSAGGGEIVSRQTVGAGDREAADTIAAIIPLAPEVVFVAASCDRSLPLLEAAKAAGLHAKFLGTELWNSPQTMRMAALGLDDLYFCRNFDHRAAGPAAAQFVADYTARFGSAPDDVAALTYDACGLVAAALEQSGKDEREALRESLARLGNFEGVAGTYRFDPGSSNPEKSMPVMQIKGSGLSWIGDFGG